MNEKLSNEQWTRTSIPAAIEMLRCLRVLMQAGYRPVDALLLASIRELKQGDMQDMYARGCVEVVVTPADTAIAALSAAVKSRTGLDNVIGQLTVVDTQLAEDKLGETLFEMDREFQKAFKRLLEKNSE